MSFLSLITNHIINADSYKVAHWSQCPEGTEYISSYIEARGSKYAEQFGSQHNYTVFFGLQAFLKDYLVVPVTQDDIDLAELLFEMHGEPFNKKGWQYIVDHHGGKLPVEIRALPEGTVLPTSNALVEIINTDPKCFWLPSYLETELQRAIWYPTTVATKSRIMKEIFREYLTETSDNTDTVLNFMLQDFGARGASSTETSALGGMAHLVNFMGTDTVMGVVATLGYYNTGFEKFLEETPDNPKRAMINLLKKMKAEGTPLPGFSVEASEHSTMTINGREGEEAQIKALIDKAKAGRIISIVSDSYDYFHNVSEVYGGKFKEDILEVGKKGGRVVIRPDSGDPLTVVPKTLELLEEKFGCETNGKGYKVLPSCVRVLWGDGIDIGTVKNVLDIVKKKGYSIENLCPFGMGGALLQKPNRDDLKFAQKASAACINGEWHDVFKDPVTSDATFMKRSKKGRLSVTFDGASFGTKRTADLHAGETDLLVPVFRNGDILRTVDFSTVRDTAEKTVALLRQTAQKKASPAKPKTATPGA